MGFAAAQPILPDRALGRPPNRYEASVRGSREIEFLERFEPVEIAQFQKSEEVLDYSANRNYMSGVPAH